MNITVKMLEDEGIPWSRGAWAVKSYMESTYGRRGSIAILNRFKGSLKDPMKIRVRDETSALFA